MGETHQSSWSVPGDLQSPTSSKSLIASAKVLKRVRFFLFFFFLPPYQFYLPVMEVVKEKEEKTKEFKREM